MKFSTTMFQDGNNTGIESAKKAHVTNIEAAKTDATRQRRISPIVEKLKG